MEKKAQHLHKVAQEVRPIFSFVFFISTCHIYPNGIVDVPYIWLVHCSGFLLLSQCWLCLSANTYAVMCY